MVIVIKAMLVTTALHVRGSADEAFVHLVVVADEPAHVLVNPVNDRSPHAVAPPHRRGVSPLIPYCISEEKEDHE
jgi:hypothetical protein